MADVVHVADYPWCGDFSVAVFVDVDAGDQLEGQVGDCAPGLVEELRTPAFAAHGRGPGGVVVDDVVGEQFGELGGSWEFQAVPPAFDELVHPRGVDLPCKGLLFHGLQATGVRVGFSGCDGAVTWCDYLSPVCDVVVLTRCRGDNILAGEGLGEEERRLRRRPVRCREDQCGNGEAGTGFVFVPGGLDATGHAVMRERDAGFAVEDGVHRAAVVGRLRCWWRTLAVALTAHTPIPMADMVGDNVVAVRLIFFPR